MQTDNARKSRGGDGVLIFFLIYIDHITKFLEQLYRFLSICLTSKRNFAVL